MRNMISQLGLAVVLATGAIAGAAAPAAAQTFELQIGPDGVRPGIRDDRYRERDRYERDRRGGPGCSPRQALAIARSEGLRNAEVIRVTPRSLTVEGDTRRGPDQMRFANVPGCPEI